MILPWCDTAMMTLHLAEIAAAIAPGRHAVLLLDQAGWHLSAQLVVPPNVTIVPLPVKCPELNPQENVWESWYYREAALGRQPSNSHGWRISEMREICENLSR